jgi:nondiscriminating glutamyl-tRNA synthetase
VVLEDFEKRAATAISEYRLMGYLPQALVNFLMLLGWSPGENKEVIDIKEVVRIFDIKNANKTASTFDIDKLNWLNNQYIRKQDSDKLTDLIIPVIILRIDIRRENLYG